MAFFSGSSDAETCTEALSTMGLMMGVGAIRVLRSLDADSYTAQRVHHFSGDLNGLFQDDDQSDVSKQKRPMFLFTLGGKF
jgi:hypothetical protein